MLGERIGEDVGKVTSQRVLPSINGAPRMETSFTASGLSSNTTYAWRVVARNAKASAASALSWFATK